MAICVELIGSMMYLQKGYQLKKWIVVLALFVSVLSSNAAVLTVKAHAPSSFEMFITTNPDRRDRVLALSGENNSVETYSAPIPYRPLTHLLFEVTRDQPPGSTNASPVFFDMEITGMVEGYPWEWNASGSIVLERIGPGFLGGAAENGASVTWIAQIPEPQTWLALAVGLALVTVFVTRNK